MIEKLKAQYDIIRKIGSGGMAEIFLAKDKYDGKLLAIKLLRPERKHDESSKRRFLSEMKLTENINSPYVVKVFDYSYDEDAQYMVMEYVDGVIMKNYVDRRTSLTPDECVEFSKQLALGLYDIHQAKIIHRDIKSSNIMVHDHGKIKIIDLGIALSDESDRLTKTDSVIGSPQYLAPEIIDREEPTKKIDIYALGILMFEMLTGKPPFEESSAVKTIMKHKNSEVPHVNKINESVPQSLANIIIKATAKNPRKRYRDMLDVYNDLKTCLSDSRIYEPVLSLNDKPRKTLLDRINSKSFLIGLLLLVIVVVAIVIVLVVVV